MLSRIEDQRLAISATVPRSSRSHLGQFFTPVPIASFMARMFDHGGHTECRLLDPGAGIGALSAAFLDHWLVNERAFERVTVDAFEIDEKFHGQLRQSLGDCPRLKRLHLRLHAGDFIQAASRSLEGSLFDESIGAFTHAILNPPYKKIRSDSAARRALRSVGIETVNMYSAFVALSLALLENNGQLVAIIPRSFCNGPYYRPFRNYIFEKAAIRWIHLFDSRTDAFQEDRILQENVIIMLERGGQQADVKVTTSADGSFTDLQTGRYRFDQIVQADDSEGFIHIPLPGSPELSTYKGGCCLDQTGVSVSTGPVVDFRLKSHLCEADEADSVPLLYPGHCRGPVSVWPADGSKKPNAIRRNDETERWLYPKGFYCVVRRFSAKEEKRRVVASVVRPDTFPNVDVLGFENHLNVFHAAKSGIPEDLAYGLCAFLNSTAVDEYFRRFNGHTQVNATDLRSLRYPSREDLLTLGAKTRSRKQLLQADIDDLVGSMC